MIDTRQTIYTYGECSDENPQFSENMIEDYMGKKEDIDTLINLLNNGDLSPQSGTGSPEGVVQANYSLLYIDTSGPNVLYFNDTFGATTGWVSVP